MTIAEAAGLGLGLLAIVSPEWVPKMRKGTRNAITLAGFLLLGYSGILLIEDLTDKSMSAGPLATVIFGAVIIAAGVFWHIRSDAPPAADSKRESPSPHNVMGPITGNKGIVTQGQKGDNKQ